MREELIARLAGKGSLTPAACFALLWTYFRHDKVDLAAAEGRVRAQWGHVLKLPPLGLSALDELPALSGAAFDVLALQILKGLDALLNGGEFSDFENAILPGIDGEPYTLRGRNHFLASRSEVTWARRQGLSLAAYCSRFMAVPSYSMGGLRIESYSRSSWGNAYLHGRLDGERNRLKIMLWPFQIPLDYPAFKDMKKKPPPLHVRLGAMENEPALQEEVRGAITEARKREVTLLIFPELSIPPDTETVIEQTLVEQGVDGYPVLTLFGRSHRRNSTSDRDLNEAVLLGPDGSRFPKPPPHRKLVPFTDYSEGEEYPCGENLETGQTVTVLECSLGNITPLICIDLLNGTIQDVLGLSHGNLLTVPSLSPKTSAHQKAADTLQPRLLACTFVCNHWNDDPPSHRSTSFYQLPVGRRFHIQPGATKAAPPYLLFDLAEA
ncbi:MAG TPA: hypothetical protein VFR03_07895 [Thermoanaerobaculia bacterium]|nr:hypothetical protein [Thermoanaerobaculia bacterium]